MKDCCSKTRPRFHWKYLWDLILSTQTSTSWTWPIMTTNPNVQNVKCDKIITRTNGIFWSQHHHHHHYRRHRCHWHDHRRHYEDEKFKSPDNITDAKGNDNQNENWCDFLIALLPWRLLLIQKAWLLKKEKSNIQNIKEGILFKQASSYCVYNESGWTYKVFQKSKIQVIKGALTIY